MTDSRPYERCWMCGSLELCPCVPPLPTPSPKPLAATLPPPAIDPLESQRQARERAQARRQRAQTGYRWTPPADDRLTIPTPRPEGGG